MIIFSSKLTVSNDEIIDGLQKKQKKTKTNQLFYLNIFIQFKVLLHCPENVCIVSLFYFSDILKLAYDHLFLFRFIKLCNNYNKLILLDVLAFHNLYPLNSQLISSSFSAIYQNYPLYFPICKIFNKSFTLVRISQDSICS